MTTLKNGWNPNSTYLKLPDYFYTKIAPAKVPKPSLVVFNKALAQELGLDLKGLSRDDLAALFSGNTLVEDAQPIALAYAGHQFGHLAFLGDGRAHLLGECTTPKGSLFDIQLKGSGQTPYGRRGDGRATLGPMLREYIISEAMHALAVPTTRSLAVVLSGEQVLRETFLPGAILTRVARSHLRIGTFTYARAKNDLSGLKALADYSIRRHFDWVVEARNPYLALLQAVIENQVSLIVHWMRIGFIHGVMNTDNIAISGETIDYGPCAFMDTYDPATVFSAIDTGGRYRYANQAGIAQWNLARFAESLLPLLDKDIDKAIVLAEEAIRGFSSLYETQWLEMMRSKLGLLGEQTHDETLIADLLEWMQQRQADYTNTFKDLTHLISKDRLSMHQEDKKFQAWYQRWQARLEQNNEKSTCALTIMQANNPVVIPRNHIVHQVLEEALQENYEPFNKLLSALANPYEERSELKPYQSPPSPGERIFQTFCGT